MKRLVLAAALLLSAFDATAPASALGATAWSRRSTSREGGQESRRRWERLCQIRHEKFDRILPEAMRENGIDMWITMSKEGLYDPLFRDFGEAYAGSIAYFIFTDRGAAGIERAAIGLSDRRIEACGEVITPGRTTLEDVSWWMWDQLLARSLNVSVTFSG